MMIITIFSLIYLFIYELERMSYYSDMCFVYVIKYILLFIFNQFNPRFKISKLRDVLICNVLINNQIFILHDATDNMFFFFSKKSVK